MKNITEFAVALAKQFMEQEKFVEAADTYALLLKSTPDDETALTNCANLYAIAKQYQKALIYYVKLEALNPNFPSIQLRIADTFFNLNRTDDATLRYKRIIQKSSDIHDKAEAHYKLGLILQRGNLTDEAKDQFKKALELNAGHLKAFEALHKQAPKRSLSSPLPTLNLINMTETPPLPKKVKREEVSKHDDINNNNTESKENEPPSKAL